MMRSPRPAWVLTLGLAVGPAAQEPPPESVAPIEFGTVDWLRDYDTARRTATAQDRDVLMLFQEVPG